MEPSANFILPLGNSVINNPGGGSFGDADPNNFLSQTTPSLGVTGSGICGASYANAAGLFKNLPGSQHDRLGTRLTTTRTTSSTRSVKGNWNLQLFKANHTHVTARAEVLYAILVEGIGPWGSVFSRDDFNDREVKDTDGDGLPEFVDAWGQPLQFFRWPVLYHSELQRGQVIFPDVNSLNTWDLVPPYHALNIPSANADIGAVFQERERDPLDPNQQLTAPQWWALTGVGGQLAANNASPFNGMSQAGSLSASGGVQAFEHFFHRLTEPIPPGAGALFWDRGGTYPRRAYYSKFLILVGRARQAARRVPVRGYRPHRPGPKRSDMCDRQRELRPPVCDGRARRKPDGFRGHGDVSVSNAPVLEYPHRRIRIIRPATTFERRPRMISATTIFRP